MLGVVLVGLAVVGGVSAFKENARKSRRDVAVAAAMRYAGDMLAWRETPAALGGGGGAFTGFSPDKVGYRIDGYCNGVSPRRPFVRLADGSQMALATSGNTDRALAVWFPNGDCTAAWKWEFHLYLTGSTLRDIKLLGCDDNDPAYPWSNGSQCSTPW